MGKKATGLVKARMNDMNMRDKPLPVPKWICREREEMLHDLKLDLTRENYRVEDKGVEEDTEILPKQGGSNSSEKRATGTFINRT